MATKLKSKAKSKVGTTSRLRKSALDLAGLMQQQQQQQAPAMMIPPNLSFSFDHGAGIDLSQKARSTDGPAGININLSPNAYNKPKRVNLTFDEQQPTDEVSQTLLSNLQDVCALLQDSLAQLQSTFSEEVPKMTAITQRKIGRRAMNGVVDSLPHVLTAYQAAQGMQKQLWKLTTRVEELERAEAEAIDRTESLEEALHVNEEAMACLREEHQRHLAEKMQQMKAEALKAAKDAQLEASQAAQESEVRKQAEVLAQDLAKQECAAAHQAGNREAAAMQLKDQAEGLCDTFLRLSPHPPPVPDLAIVPTSLAHGDSLA
eukprot:gene7608-9060_t